MLDLTWTQVGCIGRSLSEIEPPEPDAQSPASPERARRRPPAARAADFDPSKADGGKAYQDRMASTFLQAKSNGKVKLGTLLKLLSA